MNNAITDVTGLKVGHYTDLEHLTGCTVVLAPPDGAVAGVDVRGPALGTRETELLKPGHLVERAHAVLLSGGSAFGLDAAGGVQRYLEERNIGFDTGAARVPIVPAAILFDLALGGFDVRPDVTAGYAACRAAASGPIEEGCVGAGTGASVGKVLGPRLATKSGIGTASQTIGGGIVVGALIAVNALGDVIDPDSGAIIAGTRRPIIGGWLDTGKALQSDLAHLARGFTNTTIGVVATNARLNKEQVNLVAMMAHDGIARAIRPSHTLYDGDVIFALATGQAAQGDVTAVGHTAAELTATAIVRAVRAARSLGGLPAADSLAAKG